jgi:hypothetical protein
VITTPADLNDSESVAMMARLHALLAGGIDAAEAVHRLTSMERRTGLQGPSAAQLMVVGGSTQLVTSD